MYHKTRSHNKDAFVMKEQKKDKHGSIQKNAINKDSIRVNNNHERAIKHYQQAIQREKTNTHKIRFFTQLFDSNDPRYFYKRYAKRIETYSQLENKTLSKLELYREKLRKLINQLIEEQEALFPDKLVQYATPGAILLTAKRNVEDIIASPIYQSYELKIRHYQKALDITQSRIEVLNAKLKHEEMAKKANGLENEAMDQHTPLHP